VELVTDVRIGITKAADLPWRFLVKDNPCVSVKPKLARR
jgi:3-methyladenine DNA glycosylase Mpg